MPPRRGKIRRAGHFRTLSSSGSSVTAARTDRRASARAAAAWTPSGVIQTKPMPARRAPSQSRGKESPTKRVVSGAACERVERGAENRRIGLLGADAMAVRHHAEQRSEARTLAYRFKIAIEVRHDAEPVAPARALRALAGCARRRPTCLTGNAKPRSGRAIVGPLRARRPSSASRLAASASTVSASPALGASPPTSGSSAA